MDIVPTSHVLPGRAEVYLRAIAPDTTATPQEITMMNKLVLALALATGVGPVAAKPAQYGNVKTADNLPAFSTGHVTFSPRQPAPAFGGGEAG
jgi:hypothetical protein